MSEEILIQYASPTLAGLKAGNLFSVEFSGKADMQESIRETNKVLVPKGLRMIPVCEQGKRTLVYLFRPSVVKKELSADKAREILNRCGYHDGTMEQHLVRLIGRMKRKKEFPHEIGLFLGYPLEDVEGFCRKKGADCKPWYVCTTHCINFLREREEQSDEQSSSDLLVTDRKHRGNGTGSMRRRKSSRRGS